MQERKAEREGRREGRREGEKEGGREGGKEGGREGGRGRIMRSPQNVQMLRNELNVCKPQTQEFIIQAVT